MTINLRPPKSLQGIILIVIIALIGITVLSAFINSKTPINDQKRVTDINKIREALKVDFNVNGFYPESMNGKPKGIETYLDFWPTAPKPDGGCNPSQNNYTYSQRSNGSDYAVDFCLGKSQNNLAAGLHTATSEGIK